MELTKIHQSQLRFKDSHLNHPSFVEWLDKNVGVFTQDWGRIYNLEIHGSEYGTTFWFLREEDAILTLLVWS